MSAETPPPLPADVQELIARCVHSSAALELLLLLHRSPETYWSVTAAASALGASEERLANTLTSLQEHGLVQQARETMAFRYAPEKEEARRTVDALVSAYERQRLTVLDAVHAVHIDSARWFAEAFRIRPR